MMMALGVFVFQLSTASYQELQRQTSWRHPSNSRVGNSPGYQFVGKGEDAITLAGEIYPELTGYQSSLDLIRNMADTGKAFILIEGTGKIYGMVIIESVQENRGNFFSNGGARKISFNISLKIVKQYQPSIIGSLGSMAVNIGNRLLG
ncbi:phage tail protein [Acinetobacter bereziniae]|uniref:phage tail protein n=1 Tax=Acinetobacter bereziniae TaxID=106648 RepID=UPI0019003BCF|nr:phage tail protein [Acinetobacter bereziniae]MBJ8475352.1 phage tail protein [Acinetobacter bereziniae]MCU4317109.1 phage tail protein [Acinetobacter bereziniae]MCV2441899.1 phage tail protein [Acinetobacter bereziniae]